MRKRLIFTEVPKSFSLSLVIAVLLFIVLYMAFFFVPPTSLGIIPHAMTTAIESHPGHADLANPNELTSQMVEDNPDLYNSYLRNALFVWASAILVSILLFISAMTLLWNFIIRKSFHIKGFFKIVQLYLLLLVTFLPAMIVIGLLNIGLTFAVGSFGNTAAFVFNTFTSMLLFAFMIHVVLYSTYLVVKLGSVTQAFKHSFNFGIKKIQYFLSSIGISIILTWIFTIASSYVYVKYFAFSHFLVLCSIVIPLAWYCVMLHLVDELYRPQKKAKRSKKA